MSLKAKLEAVIYAAEEPVTLVQLAALFATEAIEWKEAREIAPRPLDAEPDRGQDSVSPEPQDTALPEQDTEAALFAEPSLASLNRSPGMDSEMDPGGDSDTESSTDSTIDAEAERTSWSESATSETAEPPTEPTESIEQIGQTKQAGQTGPTGLTGQTEQTEQAGQTDLEPAADESELKRSARLRDRAIREALRAIIAEIAEGYVNDERGIEIREIAGGYRMATKPECHDAVRAFVKSLKPPLKLSLPALETLAVIAYKQPVTSPEVSEIRGVDTSGVLGSLIARKLITTAGRKQVIGRPILYKTTREFLLRFGLKDLTELPSMEEFEKMAAIELDEPETANDYERTNAGDSRAAQDATHPEFEEDTDEEADNHGPHAEVGHTESTESTEAEVSGADKVPTDDSAAVEEASTEGLAKVAPQTVTRGEQPNTSTYSELVDDPAAMAESATSLATVVTEDLPPAEPAETEATLNEGH